MRSALKRTVVVSSLALLLTAASPADKTLGHGKSAALGSLHRPAADVTLPVPPLPPADMVHAQEGFRPAPVPNLDATPPVDADAEKPHTELVPSLFAKPDLRSGDGYVPGSASSYDPDRRWHAAPSLTVKVPIQ